MSLIPEGLGLDSATPVTLSFDEQLSLAPIGSIFCVDEFWEPICDDKLFIRLRFEQTTISDDIIFSLPDED